LPTPIKHLRIAERVLVSGTLPGALCEQMERDDAVWGAFFFGHIAPDVQVISRQTRESTHFFALPPTNRRPAFEVMLATYPHLAQTAALPPAQVAFLAGYLSHLLLDEFWVRDIFFPLFGPGQIWGEQRERILLHNVLRTWLAQRDLPQLQDGIGDLLRKAEPKDWLPFAKDVHLRHWRDLVADQFAPGAEIRTVEIFANRARIPNSEFLALLEPKPMQERIFSRIPLAEVDRFYDRAFAHTQEFTVSYLNGCTVTKSG
jgi:hypothetical protein